jgi:hypothetical protein
MKRSFIDNERTNSLNKSAFSDMALTSGISRMISSDVEQIIDVPQRVCHITSTMICWVSKTIHPQLWGGWMICPMSLFSIHLKLLRHYCEAVICPMPQSPQKMTNTSLHSDRCSLLLWSISMTILISPNPCTQQGNLDLTRSSAL